MTNKQSIVLPSILDFGITENQMLTIRSIIELDSNSVFCGSLSLKLFGLLDRPIGDIDFISNIKIPFESKETSYSLVRDNSYPLTPMYSNEVLFERSSIINTKTKISICQFYNFDYYDFLSLTINKDYFFFSFNEFSIYVQSFKLTLDTKKDLFNSTRASIEVLKKSILKHEEDLKSIQSNF